MTESDSDDIEVVSVQIAPDPSANIPSDVRFMWGEISQNDVITPESLRRALDKYEVTASDDQIDDMLKLLGASVTTPTLHKFIDIVKLIQHKT